MNAMLIKLFGLKPSEPAPPCDDGTETVRQINERTRERIIEQEKHLDIIDAHIVKQHGEQHGSHQ